jgi:superfamily II DNA or RNA helicase
MGCGVIARHKVPTLILVDRTPLVDQWKERLGEHLGLGPRDIGQLGGAVPVGRSSYMTPPGSADSA